MGTAASVYVRNSKAIGARNLSQAGMVSECEELSRRLGVRVAAIHIDNGKSGAIRDRPEFVAWLNDGREGRADVLISWAGDRLTREGINVAGMILDVVEGKDSQTGAVTRPPVRFVSVDDGLDSEHGDAFRMNFMIKAEGARQERERMKARSKATRERMLKEKKWPSGVAPYGTRLDSERRLEVEPVERDVLREVAQRLMRGQSMRSVLLWMGEEGLKTRRGNPWTRSSLTTTLESETTREHIFTLAESRALAERLHPKPGMRPKGGKPVRWLLSGVAKCAGCGRPMTTSRDSKRDVTRYACPTTTSIAPCPARATIRADRADAYVEEQYLEHWGDMFFWEEVVTVDGGDVDAAERARDEAQAALLADLTAENLAAAQAAQTALDEALAKPLVRRREMVQTDTYREPWERAKGPLGEDGKPLKPDTQGMAHMLAQGAHEITISKSTAPAWNPSRISITWRDEVE
jgi:site-specific DNA recombinase